MTEYWQTFKLNPARTLATGDIPFIDLINDKNVSGIDRNMWFNTDTMKADTSTRINVGDAIRGNA